MLDVSISVNSFILLLVLLLHIIFEVNTKNSALLNVRDIQNSLDLFVSDLDVFCVFGAF